jgi:glyoxylase-like metal-dependent hydrolase (beta-lactamase superfamily II)
VTAAEPTWPAFPEDPKSHTWEKVGDGVYAFISPIGITPLVTGNSLVVIGDESVLVVDTGEFPSSARAEIAEIRRLTPLPVRHVVTTHWHPDHWIGNDEFKRAYPGASFISTESTRLMAQSHGAKSRKVPWTPRTEAHPRAQGLWSSAASLEAAHAP